MDWEGIHEDSLLTEDVQAVDGHCGGRKSFFFGDMATDRLLRLW